MTDYSQCGPVLVISFMWVAIPITLIIVNIWSSYKEHKKNDKYREYISNIKK